MPRFLLPDAGEKCYGDRPWSDFAARARIAEGYTLPELRLRFAEAAETLKKLPLPKGGLPPVTAAAWPDTVQEWLAYGWTPTRTRTARPSPVEITRLDEVLQWSGPDWITADQRLVIWGRASGMTWKRIEWLDDQVSRRRHGRQRRQLKNILDDAEARILARLNGTPRRMVVTPEAMRRMHGDDDGSS